MNSERLGGSGEAISDLKQLFSLAEKFGYSKWLQFDASVVRGLAYYTGIVFEVRFSSLLIFHDHSEKIKYRYGSLSCHSVLFFSNKFLILYKTIKE